MKLASRLVASSLAAALLVAGGASAQDVQKLADTTPAQRAAVQTELMKTRLGLSEDETSKVAAINLKYAEQMQPILQSANAPTMKVNAARRVDQAKNADMKGVLSPEQFQRYIAAKEEIRQHMEQKLLEKHAGTGAP